MKMVYLLPLVVVAMAAFAGAASINIVEPYSATLYNNGTIYLGKVGPGQPFYVTADSAAANQSGVVVVRGWNQLYATGLPRGWAVSNSSIYSKYLSVKITPSANASNGTYTFNITAENFGNYSKLGSVTFTAYVNVTPDVFVLSVSPTNVTAGPGQPADITVTINNTGVSDAPFYITAVGLPAWNSSKEVIALHNTEKAFTYSVYEDEPGLYTASMFVGSVASQLVYKESGIRLLVQASVPNDYSAIGSGSVAFPVIYEPAYAIMYLIKLLFNYI